jgi:hypothetical protein
MLSALWHVACGHHALASCKIFSWSQNGYSARYAQHEATSWRAFAATMHPTVTWLDIGLILLLGRGKNDPYLTTSLTSSHWMHPYESFAFYLDVYSSLFII